MTKPAISGAKYTPAEDARIREILDGTHFLERAPLFRQLARDLRRSVDAVRTRALRIGVIDPLTPEQHREVQGRHLKSGAPKIATAEARQTVAVPFDGDRDAAIAEWKRRNPGKAQCPPAYVAPVTGGKRLDPVPVYEIAMAEMMTRQAEAKSKRTKADRVMDGVRLNTGVLV